jgi:hypothetical protein
VTTSFVSHQLAVTVDERVLRSAVAAYLGRYRGESRVHTGSDLTAARLSANHNDFTLIAMLGLLGLRIFEACGANIGDLGEERPPCPQGSRQGRQDRLDPVAASGCSRDRARRRGPTAGSNPA